MYIRVGESKKGLLLAREEEVRGLYMAPEGGGLLAALTFIAVVVLLVVG